MWPTEVIHKCEDFYEVIREERVPKFDVLLTNPPYSSDHKVRRGGTGVFKTRQLSVTYSWESRHEQLHALT
eukprot:3263464-Amphidinium_carterae.1